MKNLLFVDDEPKVLQGLQRQLRPMRNEWDINFVENGQQALAFMAAHPVDVIISDMVMPGGITGRELAGRLLQEAPGMRVIYSTGYDTDSTDLDVNPGEGDHCLPKPYDATALVRAVKKAFAATGQSVNVNGH